MLTFTLLTLIVLTIVIGVLLFVSIGGAVFIATFADVIVCALIIAGLVKLLFGRKKKEEES